MNDAVFLDAILSEPDELSHRLVFADWLEDYGQPERAEFIRLQIERDGLPLAHPCARRNLRRESVLLAEHELAWAGPIAQQARRWRFHRGFVEELDLPADQFLAHGQELFRLAPIRRLHLRNTGVLPHLLRTARASRQFAELLSRIVVLNFNREYLGEATGQKLLSLPRLPQLKALHLAQNALSPEALAVLAQSPVLEGLTTLELTQSSNAETLLGLLHSPRLQNLRHLALGGSLSGPRLAQVLLRSPLLPQLESLTLAHANLTAEGVRLLGNDENARALQSLDLSFNRLTASGALALAEATCLRGLGFLNLSSTRMANEGVEILARSPLYRRLWGVDLSLNGIREAGAVALAEVPEPAKMLSLDLIYNHAIGANGRAVLLERYGEDVCLFVR